MMSCIGKVIFLIVSEADEVCGAERASFQFQICLEMKNMWNNRKRSCEPLTRGWYSCVVCGPQLIAGHVECKRVNELSSGLGNM
jgi:hypothetical protein